MNKQDKTSFIDEQRDRLTTYMEASDDGDGPRVSGSGVARSVGVSPASISQFLNDKYTGDNFGLAKKIQSFLSRQKERLSHTEILTEPLRTKNLSRVQNVCRLCHIEGEMGVITGDAGLSKTTGLKKYHTDNPDGVILIEVIPGFTSKILMSEIHKVLKLGGEGTQVRMFQQVEEKLKGSQRLIIIDEAEHLPTKALELIRRVHDKTGIGIVLAGLPRLLENLRGLKSDYRQLYSRIGIKAELEQLNEDDVKMLVRSAIPSSNGLYKHFYKRTQNGRTLTKMLKRAIQLANVNDIEPAEINEDVVDKARDYIII